MIKGEFEDVMSPPEILGLITLGAIELLRRQQVCFYSGPSIPPKKNEIRSFSECLPYLGKCTGLIFCAPHLRRDEIRKRILDAAEERINLHWNECVGLDSDLIWRDEFLFKVGEDMPNLSRERLWGHFCFLRIAGRKMKLQLLHLGLMGDEAEKFFLKPHRISTSVVISNPGQ